MGRVPDNSDACDRWHIGERDEEMKKAPTVYDMTVKENKQLKAEIVKKDKTIRELSDLLSEFTTYHEGSIQDLSKPLLTANKLLKSASVRNAERSR